MPISQAGALLAFPLPPKTCPKLRGKFLKLQHFVVVSNWDCVDMGNQSRGNPRISFSKKNGISPPDLPEMGQKERGFDKNVLLHRTVRRK